MIRNIEMHRTSGKAAMMLASCQASASPGDEIVLAVVKDGDKWYAFYCGELVGTEQVMELESGDAFVLKVTLTGKVKGEKSE